MLLLPRWHCTAFRAYRIVLTVFTTKRLLSQRSLHTVPDKSGIGFSCSGDRLEVRPPTVDILLALWLGESTNTNIAKVYMHYIGDHLLTSIIVKYRNNFIILEQFINTAKRVMYCIILWVAAEARWFPSLLKVARSINGWAEAAPIYTTHEALSGYCPWGPMRPVNWIYHLWRQVVAGCGRLQLGAPHWAT